MIKKISFGRCFSAIGLLVWLLLSAHASAQFTQFISVGDSLSDTGNTFDVSLGFQPASPNNMGRFSNGLIWNELLANELGLIPPTPSRDGGDNYAYGGALSSLDVQIVIIPFLFVITLPSATSQIFDFLGDVGNVVDPNALYTFSIGGNDIIGAGEALSANPTGAQLAAAEQEMMNIAGSLEVALQQWLDDFDGPGEGRIVILNAPNVGITPRAIADGKETVFEALSIAYNDGLSDVVDSLNDPRLLLVDFFELTNMAVANPSQFGLSNVTARCWSESANTICPNPDEYLFWDDIHPTAMGHTLLMIEVLDRLFPEEEMNVPIPIVYIGGLLVLLMGVVRLSGRRRLSA